MELKTDREVLEYVSKILKTQIEDLEVFDGKLNDVEETMSSNDLEVVNDIVESINLDLQENLNRGLIINLDELVNFTKNIVDVFEELDNKLSKGVDA